MIHIQTKEIAQSKPTIITIGNFDGMHKGHVKLINETVSYAKEKGLQSLVLTFSPHPRVILRGEKVPHIFSSTEKAKALQEMGVDIFIEYPFDKEFANYSPKEFLQEILHNKLNASAIVVGENYHFGKHGTGDINMLQGFAKNHNIDLLVKQLQLQEGATINSTSIRKAIQEGNISLANKMLGRAFYIDGIVLSGEQRGRQIGFPTANLIPHPTKVLPKNGVYITSTHVDGGAAQPSITNIGIKPTFDGEAITIETHVLDFSADIYSKTIGINFLDRIRDEQKFSGLDELKENIKKDSDIARQYHKI